MKILLVNKFHSRRDGAARAYFDTAEILMSHGHEVAFFAMHGERDELTPWSRYFINPVNYRTSHSIGEKWQLVKAIWWNREAQRKLNALIDEFQPDVAHLHVTYHQLSPSIIATLKKRGVPMVMTLHDYKFVCPNYSMYVRGHIWEGGALRCIWDRCVMDSYAKSFVCAFESMFHKVIGIYKKVDAYIAPSKFLIQKFREHKFFADIEYVPQPLSSKDRVASGESDFLLFSGSLAAHKGVDVLLRAMKNFPEEILHIVGDGPDRERLQILAKNLGIEKNIFFLGHLFQEKLKEELRKAKMIIIPSVWFENMPYALLEALASGKRVIASKIGGMTERVTDGKNGFLFTAGDVEDLTRVIKKALLLNKKSIREIEEKARRSVNDLQPEKYYKKLMIVYNRIKKEI